MASNSSSGGIGAAGILGIIFVCAKIFGVQPVASWDWVWVLCPFWIGLAIFFGILAIMGVLWLVAATGLYFLDGKHKARR